MRGVKSGSGAMHVGMFGRPTIFREIEDDPTGGGGQSAEEKLFEERFNRLFHKSIGPKLKGLEERLTKSVTSGVNTRLDEIAAMIAEDKDTPGSGAGDGAGGGTVKSTLTPEQEAQWRQMQIDAKAAKEKADKWEAEAKAEKVRNMRAEERSELTKLLSGKVRPAMADLVLDHLHGKHVTREAETNNIRWKEGDDMPLLPLKEGVEFWIKSEAGKEFAPPVAARGTGAKGPGDDTTVPTKAGTMTADGLANLLFEQRR